MVFGLSSGAEARITGTLGGPAVVCVNGGQGREVPGTWSASLEWLVGHVAPQLPELAFLEVRYRVKSWNRLGMCVEDAVAAVEHAVAAGARQVALVGFSMGGAVAIRASAHPAVPHVIGLAPWFPPRFDLSPLAGRRLDVIHGSLDRWLPGIPGVSAASSRAGFERARAQGAAGTYTLLRGALHAAAFRGSDGSARPLPRAGRWAALLADLLGEFAAAA